MFTQRKKEVVQQPEPSNPPLFPATSSSTSNILTASYNHIYKSLDLGNKLPEFLTNQTAHLPGFATVDLWQPGGLNIVINKAEDAAKSHPSQICRFYIGPYLAAYVRDQTHLKSIYYDKPTLPDTGLHGDSSGIYPFLFGPSILSYTENDPRWKKDREFYRKALMDASRLEFASKKMVAILQRQLQSQPLETVGNIAELRQFINRSIMTMVAETQLGLVDLTIEEKDRLIKLVTDMLPHISNLKNIAYLKIEEKLGCRPRLPLDKIRSEGYAFLQSLIERNKEYILREPQQINDSLEMEPELFFRQYLRRVAEEAHGSRQVSKRDLDDVLMQQSQRFAALVLFASYESTSTSTFFNLLLLSDPNHAEICEEVRKNVLSEWNPVQSLSKENLDKMSALDAAVREGLRLYPPFPTFKDYLSHDVQLGDVKLSKSTFIFISPFRAHRNNNMNNIDNPQAYNLHYKLNEVDSKCQFITFGYPPRTCPGRYMAMLENKIIVAYLLANYKLTLRNFCHPFPVEEVYSLRLQEALNHQELKIDITPQAMEAEISHESAFRMRK